MPSSRSTIGPAHGRTRRSKGTETTWHCSDKTPKERFELLPGRPKRSVNHGAPPKAHHQKAGPLLWRPRQAQGAGGFAQPWNSAGSLRILPEALSCARDDMCREQRPANALALIRQQGRLSNTSVRALWLRLPQRIPFATASFSPSRSHCSVRNAGSTQSNCTNSTRV